MTKLIPQSAVSTIAGCTLVFALASFPAASNAADLENDSKISSVTSIVADNHSQSVFDQLFSTRDADGLRYDVPFPFSSLVNKIEQHLGRSINNHPNKIKFAQFPLSRCVNRYAANPDFFKFPRIVLAVDSEEMNIGSQDTMLLKDQLFIGYQQQARSLEIISYNNEEGKFDFQVVSDYTESSQPKVANAKRQDCVSCHQNQGPLFHRAYWNETDNNPDILEAIAQAQGFSDQEILPVSKSRPDFVNGAVSRANMFSLYQTLWQKGCQSDDASEGILCRAALFETVMLDQLAETYRRQVPSAQVSKYLVEIAGKNIARLWPQGIQIPSSVLPSRNPLLKEPFEYLRSAKELEHSRAETIHWQPDDLYRVVKGLGGLIAKSNILGMDQTLGRISDARQTSGVSREGTCRIGMERSPIEPPYENRFSGGITLECHWKDNGLSGELNLLGDLYVNQDKIRSNSFFNNVVLDGRNFLAKFAHQGGEIISSNGRSRIQLTLFDSNGKLRARLPNGRTIENLDISWEDPLVDAGISDDTNIDTGKATLRIRSNPRILEEAISELANNSHSEKTNVFSNKPFNAQNIMSALLTTLDKMEIDSLVQSSRLSSAIFVD